MEYFLGIDIGTTSVKSIAFSADGSSLCEHSVSYSIHHPYPDWSEQDPEEITRATLLTVENILHDLSPDLPRVCSFSAAMHSLIAVDREGHALCPSIIWADNRAADIAEKIKSDHQAETYYRLTGLPIHAMSPFCKLLWLKENRADLFDAAFKFVGIKEFIFFRLFGVWKVDASIAAATGLMNGNTIQWDPWILGQVGLPRAKLSDIVYSDENFDSPQIFPALKKIPFVIGGSDGAMSNWGATSEKGALVVTVGTSSAARIFTAEKQLDPAMRTFSYFLDNHHYLSGGASNNGGIVLQWLQEDFFQRQGEVSDFLQQASAIPPGSNGLIFLPYLLGERAPLWNAHAKGVLFGMDINHDQATLIRASMEAVVYCLLDISEPLLERSDIKKICATGGFAKNELWLQILSDAFHLPVTVNDTVESSAWGAAKWGMQSVHIPPVGSTPTSKTFLPDSRASAIYASGFQKFQRLYRLLHSEFK